jgi:xanthine dehydrogenase accessory factor
MRDLLEELTKTIDQGRDCVYCAVVETRGSTPQKAGAAMLVFPDGSQRGTLGGGCVEAEVKQRALGLLTACGRAEVLTFNLDDNYGWDDGLICGGRMSMLVDPISPNASSIAYYRRFFELVDQGQGCTQAVVLKAQDGRMPASRYLFDARGELAGQVAENGNADEVRRHVSPLDQRPRPASHQGIAYLPVLPRITLFIVGGGHVGQAVGWLAAEADFDIWVLDDREAYANSQRFPAAARIMIGDIGATLKSLATESISPSFYCIIVTRGHNHDEEALFHLVNTRAGYVGMIGSRRKIKLIYEDLIAKGVAPEVLEKVHAPLGFEIGSQTVPEIAVSIVAELIACRNLGTSRTREREPVHPGNVRA